MASDDYNGPAFPVRQIFGASDHPGMTLRDYFAAKAMQGVVASDPGELDIEKCAEWAYQMADAMLEKRK